MLQSIRDGIQGWVSALIIGVICVPFAFWGVTSYFTGGGDVVVAEVDDGEISQASFQRAYQSQYQAEQRRLGNAADLIDEQALKLQVLESLVSREAITQHVQKVGYDIDDAKIVEAITRNPYLQQDGEFSQSRYGQFLAALGMDASSYEASLRTSLRVGQLQAALVDSVTVSDDEVERLWRLQNQTRDVAAVQIKVQDLLKSVKVSDEDIQAWYEDNLDNYVSEERLRVQYIELNLADLSERVDVSDEDIAARYEEDKDRFVTPEQRRASHILIGGDASDAAKEKLEALKARVLAGENFADLAKANSDDPGSAANGGDLGLVARGVMVKPFEEALFDLDQAGDLSDIVETQFGLHLIQLDEIQTEQGQSLEQARIEIDTTLRAEKAEALFTELLDQLAELSYENPSELETVADALELNVRTSGWFTRNAGTGVATDEAVRDAAFGNTVLQDDENSELIELGDERALVLRKSDHQPSEQQSLAAVKADIEALLRNRAAREKADQLAAAVLDSVESGTSLKKAAKAENLKATDLGAIKRDSSALGPVALRDIFALPHPQEGEVEAGRSDVLNGDVVVYVLTAVTEADVSAEGVEEELASLRAGLENQRGRAELFATLRDIRESSSVKLHLNRL